MKHILLYPVLLICFLACLPANALPYVFSRLDASDGLSDNQVQHILQLPDGRMVFTTLGNINLYDGMRFHYIHRNDSDVYAIDGYHGHYHVYVGDHERLWVKDYGKAWCLDLRHERYLKQPEQVFSETGIREKVNDLFVDSEKGLWLVSSKGIWETRKKRYILLPKDAGELRENMGVYNDSKDLIDIGAYKKGSNAVIDYAVSLHVPIEDFLKQRVEEYSSFEETESRLHGLFEEVPSGQWSG